MVGHDRPLQKSQSEGMGAMTKDCDGMTNSLESVVGQVARNDEG